MPHLYLVGSVNAIVLFNISLLYFYQNLSSQASPVVVSAVDNGYLILVPGAQILAVCSLWHLGQALLVANPRRFRPLRSLIMAALAVILQSTLFLSGLNIAGLPVFHYSHHGFELLALVTAYMIIGQLIAKAGRAKPIAKQHVIRSYGIILAGALTLAVLMVAMSWLKWIPAELYTSLLAVLVLAANLIPVLYYHRILLPRFHQSDPSGSADESSIQFREAYDLSARECEVVELLCRGHTNKEIAEMMFISLQTVKDHVSRIYRKTGVRNRVQLIAKLGNRPDYQNPQRSE
jgi:DNA-binding CsgD family transcriptional regulator